MGETRVKIMYAVIVTNRHKIYVLKMYIIKLFTATTVNDER